MGSYLYLCVSTAFLLLCLVANLCLCLFIGVVWIHLSARIVFKSPTYNHVSPLLWSLDWLPIIIIMTVLKSPKYYHVSPLLRSLLWLPITQRIDYKLSFLCLSVSNGMGPEYLPDLLTIYSLPPQFRSASDTRVFGNSFKTIE